MSAGATPAQTAPPRDAITVLYESLRHMSAAERRLHSLSPGPGGLTFPQVRALAALAREHEMTAGELARSAELQPASVSALLDSLERLEIVRRTRSTTDRRVCNVSLTDAGRALFERRFQAWQQYWNRRLQGISDEDLQTAARVLDAVAELYEAAPGELHER